MNRSMRVAQSWEEEQRTLDVRDFPLAFSPVTDICCAPELGATRSGPPEDAQQVGTLDTAHDACECLASAPRGARRL